MHILQITSSICGEASHSTRLARRIVDHLLDAHPGATVTRRDLALNPPPWLDAFALQALSTPPAERTPEQARRVAQDVALIAEVQAADRLVLGVPMYNFAIPAQLKAWTDAITQAGVTFRYTDQGPEGLLTGKRVYLALTRGGVYRDTPMDTQAPYLLTLLGFLGMTAVDCVYAEGLALGPEAKTAAFDAVEAQLAALNSN